MTRTLGASSRLFGLGRVASVLIAFGLAAACVISYVDRSQQQLPDFWACKLPTPNACIRQLALEPETDGRRLERRLAYSAHLASSYPANARAQAVHAYYLSQIESADAPYFFMNSARLGWRERTGQMYSYLAAASTDDFDRALLHLDALLKLDLSFAKNDALMDVMLDSPQLRSAFAERLVQNPEYLGSVLATYFEDQEHKWEERLSLLSEARQAGLEPSDDVIRNTVWRTFWADPSKAAELWANLMGPGDWADGQLAWDVSAKRWPIGKAISPFVWHRRARTSPPIEVVDRPRGRMIELTSSASSSTEMLASIALPMNEGRYAMRWTYSGERNELFLQPSCASGNGIDIRIGSATDVNVMEAMLVVRPDCTMPFLSVHKARGEISPNAALGVISIQGAAVLK